MNMNLKYTDFTNEVKKEINKVLEDGTYAELRTVEQMNGRKKCGITIRTEKVNVSPTIYLEEFYESFKNGCTMEMIISRIESFYHEVRVKKSIDTGFFLDYQRVKDKVVFKVINKEMNLRLLRDTPHYIIMEDLALVFYVILNPDERIMTTMNVTKQMFERWNISMEELYKIAQENIKKLLPIRLSSIEQIMEELSRILYDEDVIIPTMFEECEMYMLTNEKKNFGAASIIYDGVLEMVGEYLKKDFYILPSSTHEVLIVPSDCKMEREELDEMIRDANESVIEVEEILSNHSYFYNRDSKKIS